MTTSEQTVEHDRPHQGGWGEPASRAQLWRIADDLRRRAGFRICAIEVRRSDDMMEFVAIAGDDPDVRELEGQSSPLDAMYPAVELGDVVGVFTFVPWESMTQEAWDRIEPYVVVPEGDIPTSPDAWHPQDMLVARLVDGAGRLRAFVYFDVPDSGLRPTYELLTAMSADLDVSLQAVITTIEREEYAAGIRLATGARVVVRSAASRHGLGELLRVAGEELHRAFRAEVLAVDVFGEALTMHPPAAVEVDAPPLHPALQDAARACWARQRVVLVDGTRVWGDDDLDAQHRDELVALLAAARVGRGGDRARRRRRRGARHAGHRACGRQRCLDRRRELGGPRRRAGPGTGDPQRPCLPARAGGGRGAASGRRLPRGPHRHPRPRAQEPDRGGRGPRGDARVARRRRGPAARGTGVPGGDHPRRRPARHPGRRPDDAEQGGRPLPRARRRAGGPALGGHLGGRAGDAWPPRSAASSSSARPRRSRWSCSGTRRR